MDFNSELKKLNDELDRQSSEYERLLETKKRKLEDAIKSINEHYDKLIKLQTTKLERNSNNVEEYKKEIVEYSIFSVRDLGEVIATIVKIYEGLDYIYTETYFDSDRRDSRIVIAGPNLYNISSIIGTNLDPFRDGNSSGILLSKTNLDREPAKHFYKINRDRDLELCMELKHFPYVKEFIDTLISYKMHKKKSCLSLEELKDIRNKFILDRVDEISDYHYEVEKRNRKKFEESIDKMRKNKQYFLESCKKD